MAKIPKWLLQKTGLTTRQWKSRKRRELREVNAALGKYRLGCAYTPEQALVHTLQSVLEKLNLSLSVKNWGR